MPCAVLQSLTKRRRSVPIGALDRFVDRALQDPEGHPNNLDSSTYYILWCERSSDKPIIMWLRAESAVLAQPREVRLDRPQKLRFRVKEQSPQREAAARGGPARKNRARARRRRDSLHGRYASVLQYAREVRGDYSSRRSANSLLCTA